MRILLIIILLIFSTSAFSETTEVEVKEARTLVTATEKVSISSEIAARVEKINFLMGDAFKKGDVLSEQLKRYRVGLLTLKIRKSCIAGLNPPLNIKYHIIGDFDLVIRLLINFELDYSHEPLAYYRLHQKNESHKNRTQHIKELKNWTQDILKIKEIKYNQNLKFVVSIALSTLS